MINYAFNIIRNKNRVKSSNVKGYKYNTEDKTLIIEFNDGSKYLYEFVEFEQLKPSQKVMRLAQQKVLINMDLGL